MRNTVLLVLASPAAVGTVVVVQYPVEIVRQPHSPEPAIIAAARRERRS
jgi:hypothetical protein